METVKTPLVQGINVEKKYGDFLAVDRVDFTVRYGECFGFLGPNGAGKTSVMKMIQCFLPVTTGSITVDGYRAGKDDRKIKYILGIAPQDETLDTDLTVIQNLEVYAGYFDIPKRTAMERAGKLLELFHLADRPDISVRALSGGMRRRLTIARALINEPKLLILDEPTTGLDPQARRVIWRKLQSLKEEGVTMILTTHYMEEATRLCDRVAIMDEGKILQTGVPAKLIEENIGANVVEIRLPMDDMPQAQKTLDDLQANYETVGDTIIIFTSDPGSIPSSIAGARGSVSARPANLEDLFLRITGHHLEGGR